ncbi:MAG TPA: helix-turn-helix domain-containing protein [Rickettsiales bacterium]|nr:helix-turn-helix domain-containing protein [Rickettsiales bacterium]
MTLNDMPVFDPVQNPANCPMVSAIAIIGGKWKLPILFQLRSKTLRFSEIRKSLAGVTQKMLTQQLRELESDGLITRTVYPEVPPRVEYSITPIGKRLEPILAALCTWGLEYRGVPLEKIEQLLKAHCTKNEAQEQQDKAA